VCPLRHIGALAPDSDKLVSGRKRKWGKKRKNDEIWHISTKTWLFSRRRGTKRKGRGEMEGKRQGGKRDIAPQWWCTLTLSPISRSKTKITKTEMGGTDEETARQAKGKKIKEKRERKQKKGKRWVRRKLQSVHAGGREIAPPPHDF